MIGQTISHYKILEKLGEGGMGVVYKAEDVRLDRVVALKFLSRQLVTDQSAKKRFVREAKAASALDHENICHIYEIDVGPDGNLFIAMPFYEGEALSEKISRGPLDIAEALDVIVQVASGLSKAHEKGIVHRDIKSGNIMVTPDGRAKILDFGLATRPDATRVTRTGMTVGTVAYMSPEQAQGKETDHRTDIWSLGVVLYEILSGELPFKGGIEQAMMYSLLNEDPEPLTSLRPQIPLEIERVVMRALAKDPAKRYPDLGAFVEEVEDLRDRLHLLPKRSRAQLRMIRHRRRITATAVSVAAVAVVSWFGSRFLPLGQEDVARVAVLPCAVQNSESDAVYLGDGATEDIIMQLAKIHAIQPMSILSVLQYRNTTARPSEIAAELEVGWLLRSSIRRDGEQVAFAAQFIDARTEAVVWAETYERRLDDVQTLWRDVALKIVRSLGVPLSANEQELLTEVRGVNHDAYMAYQKGRERWRRRKVGKSDLDEAITYFQGAIALDPGYALAYAGLADAYAMYATPAYRFGTAPYVELLRTYDSYMEKARDAVNEALRLDPNLAEAHATRGFILAWTDAQRAEESFRRAFEIKPNYGWAHYWFSDVLSGYGRHDEAIAENELAVSLIPGVGYAKTHLGRILACAGQYDRAIGEIKAGIALDPEDEVGYSELMLVHLYTGNYGEAQQAMRRYCELTGMDPDFWNGIFGALRGEHAASEAQAELDYTEDNLGPYFAAVFYAALGNHERAVEMLEKGYAMRDFMTMRYIARSPLFDPLRTDPRLKKILRGLGFSEQREEDA